MGVIFSLRSARSSRQSRIGPETPSGLFLQGEGDAVCLLIHGLTGTPNEMRFIALALNKKGYTVYCPRLANHGEPLGILKGTKWQAFYESVREAFLELKAKHPASPIFVSGLCMGALLGILLAREFPDDVRGLNLLAPTFFYDGWNVPWQTHLLPLAYYTPLKHFFYFREESPYGLKSAALRNQVERYYKNAKLEDIKDADQYGYPFFPVTLLHELERLARYVEKRLSSVTVPTQILQAFEDDSTSIRNSMLVYRGIRSTVKEIAYFYDSYHLINIDQERKEVAGKILQFFDRLNPASTANAPCLETETLSVR